MRQTTAIPVNNFGGEYHPGISIDRISLKALPDIEAAMERSERHDRHSFHLLEQGVITMEIDFQTVELKAPCLTYMHPDQVHRLRNFKHVTVSSWAINDVNLNPEYLSLLEGLNPAKPLRLHKEARALITEAFELCLKCSLRPVDQLYHALLRDSCNTLVALAIAQYTARSAAPDQQSRSEYITKAFRDLLEQHYTTVKRPASYARKLNISVPYLNECVRNSTGHPVSYHIQHRIILEAKRLLYHSAQSVKEIAATLGYDDYPYFSRLFTKVTGMSALAFRRKNLD